MRRVQTETLYWENKIRRNNFKTQLNEELYGVCVYVQVHDT